ncbi:MAG TPA: hypothetical protein VGH29_17135 [Candidatus Binataceae bacterium]
MYRCLLLAVVVLTQGCAAAGWENFGASPGPRDVVEARKFVLVDTNDKAIAELGAAPGGSGLVLMDSTGKPRAALVLTKAGEPGLKLYDGAGVVRAALVVGNDGRSGLALYDAGGGNSAALAASPQGAPALLFFDRGGRVITQLPASAR